MKNIKEITVKKIKIFTSFLEKQWRLGEILNTSPINSLAPKVLTEENDLKTIRPYLNSLKQAIDTTDINNIAITGSYGSGKSTILKTFQRQNKEYEYLNISLASFKDNKDKPDDPEFERRLEVSILQQMFYHVEPSKIPDSRFKRIVNLTPINLFFFTLFLILWILCSLTLFRFGYIDKLNPNEWRISYSLDWIACLSSIIFFIGNGLFVKNIYRLFKNSKINKLNIKGELELGEAIDKSVFNQHLEEILYFFERTKFNVVVIEDVDRFDSTDIFTKLREINILINNSNLIKRPVKFVYAIKDEMFKDKNERVKFFEFIIPVIPFINPSNASDQLTKLIENAKLEGELTADFTSDVVTFIDDIDMRLLINIFHEYQLYRKILSNDLSQDNLFAIIVYKNLHPDDFGDLQRRKGNLYDFFSNKPTYIKNIIEQSEIQIKEINEQIKLLEDEIDKPIKELRAVYIHRLVANLNNFHSFYVNKNVSIVEAVEDEYFNEIKSSKNIEYIQYEFESYYGRYKISGVKYSNLNFKNIEQEISNKLTYNQREKLLLDKANNKINKLKVEIDRIRRETNEVESMSILELFERIDPEEHFGYFKENNLMRNLLLNGYIDEHYDDYISLFHGVLLTKEDFKFESAVKSGRSLAFDFQLTRVENLIKELPDKYFGKGEILNNQLITFLLENELKYKRKLESVFHILSQDGKKQFDFIYGFIKNEPNKIGPFIKKLCEHKPTLWEYIQNKSELPDDEIKGLLKHIFDYGDKSSILRFNSLDSLGTYLAQMNNFYAFCASLKQTNTIQSFVIERKILFENLDLPSENQKQLFEIIYTKNLYYINEHNILCIVKGNGVTVDKNDLNVSHYSTLLKLGLKNLLSYINDNIQDYIEHVMLLVENNKEEEEKTIVDILNREDVSLDLKAQVIRSQNAKIYSIKSIDDFEVKQVVLKSNKLTVDWNNIFDYFDATEKEEFDDVLIAFLNEAVNHEILDKQKLRVNGREEEYIKKISNILLQCEALEIHAYTSLIDSLPYKYNRLNFDKLNEDKIEALLSKKILTLTSDNFNGLKSKGSNLHIKIIEVHQDKFVEKMNELSLDANDWNLVFKSHSIVSSYKLSILKKIDLSLLSDRKIAHTVFNIVPEDQYIPLNYELLNEMFDVHNSVSKKIALLSLNLDDLDDNQVQSIVGKLGEKYAKIFLKQHKPTFTNSPQHIALFEKLQKRGMIKGFKVNKEKEEVKVTANY